MLSRRPTSLGLGRSRLNDYLGANEVWRRTLWLDLETDQLLKMPRSKQAWVRRLVEEVRSQVAEQMRRADRRAFRGEVSVEMLIHAPGVPNPPSAPSSVKAYLDAFKGLVYRDDRQVGHLLVSRFADDHPLWGDAKRARPERQQPPTVMITVAPLRVYQQDFDRAFRLRHELEHDHDWDGSDGNEALAYFEDTWNSLDDDELRDLLDERRDEAEGKGLYDPRWDLATHARELSAFRERQIRALQSKMLFDQRPGPSDRPGPEPYEHGREFLELAHVPPFPRRVELPGGFQLPLPPDRPGAERQPRWEDAVRKHMVAHRERWPMLPEAMDQPLALDIAIRGGGPNARDIDNLAHGVLVPFEATYCGSARGTVTAYRVYRARGTDPSVHVKVMTEERLTQLANLMAGVRRWLLASGPRER